MRRGWIASVLLMVTLAGCPAPGQADFTVTVDPDSPTTSDDLVALVDGPVGTPTFEWVRGGSTVPGASTDTLMSDQTRKGETWMVRVYSADDSSGAFAADTVTIANTAPTASVSIEPQAPGALDDLMATGVGEDVDGDPVDFSYSWTVDGSPAGVDGDRVPASETASGQVWTVTATPSDGESEGEPVTATVTVDNEPPTLVGVDIVPEVFHHGVPVTAEGYAEDPEGAPLTYSYTWFVNDLQVGQGDSLAGTEYAKGDIVTVEAVASDGSADSEPLLSDDYVTGNAPPTLASARVSPEVVRADTEVSCEAGGAVDPDGDTITFTTTWFQDGTEVAEGAGWRTADLVKGQTIACAITPFDGSTSGAEVRSADVTLVNSPPRLTKVRFVPATPRTGDDLAVLPVTVVEPDDDPVTYAYVWTINGTRNRATGNTLPSSEFEKDDVVEVTVTPNDGETDGTPATKKVTIQNTPPKAPTIGFRPNPPREFKRLQCEILSPATDADGDPLTYTFSWEWEGSAFTRGVETTLYPDDSIDSYFIRRKQSWECTVTVSDGTATASDSVFEYAVE